LEGRGGDQESRKTSEKIKSRPREKTTGGKRESAKMLKGWERGGESEGKVIYR